MGTAISGMIQFYFTLAYEYVAELFCVSLPARLADADHNNLQSKHEIPTIIEGSWLLSEGSLPRSQSIICN